MSKITPPKRFRRRDEEFNDKKVRDAFYEIVKESDGSRLPTMRELSERTGLHKTTIQSHLKNINKNSDYTKYRSLTPRVILAIYKCAVDGIPASQKLWLEVVEGFSQKQEITGKNGKAIQFEVSEKPFTWFGVNLEDIEDVKSEEVNEKSEQGLHNV